MNIIPTKDICAPKINHVSLNFTKNVSRKKQKIYGLAAITDLKKFLVHLHCCLEAVLPSLWFSRGIGLL